MMLTFGLGRRGRDRAFRKGTFVSPGNAVVHVLGTGIKRLISLICLITYMYVAFIHVYIYKILHNKCLKISLPLFLLSC